MQLLKVTVMHHKISKKFSSSLLVHPNKSLSYLWDSCTPHIASLLLWSTTSVHQQLCLSGHRVLGDIGCDWSTPHVGPSLGDLLPEPSHAKDQSSDFCLFMDNGSKYPKLWILCYSWKQKISYSSLRCIQENKILCLICQTQDCNKGVHLQMCF